MMLTTCLSPAVHKMVCQLGFEIQDNIEIMNILHKDNKVRWDAICSKVHYASSGLDYAESVRQLGPLCEAVHLYFLSLPNEKFEEAFREYFHWTNNIELFLGVPAVLKSMDGTKISLLLMKMTSCLERALGDVYLTVGKDCPFLLRDLLASEELATIFTKSVMDVLRIFLGSPESLNLRNILWHGFASPHDIPSKYCSVLLLFTGGLGQVLQAHHCNSGTSLAHRPYFVFHCAEELQVFPDLDNEVLSLSEKLVEESKFVLANMVPYWKEAITAFRHGRYADCAILILPQLETGLRFIFTTVNNCPDRLLTAESNILYTTFDEILAKYLNDASDNNMPNALGEPAMEFLWDVLNHQEGPRVRDHLSHGEIQLSEFPRQFANDLMGFSIVLLNKHCNHNDTDKESAILGPLIDAVGSYRSRFHPVALLQKQVLKCMESLQKWFLLPSPSIGHISSTEGSDEMKDIGISIRAEIVHVLSLLQHQRMSCFSNYDWDLQTDQWFVFMNELCSKHFSVLYCHRWVVEVVSILRRITTKCQLVSINIISTLKLKYEQWENKTLRSRQRQNYIRLLRSTNTLSLVIRLILTLIILDLHNIHSVTMKMAADYQKYLKYLKSILQFAENISTYTNQDKNRWDEAMHLATRIIMRIRMFFEASNLNKR